MKKAKKPILITVILLVLMAIGVAVYLLSHYLKIRADFDRLQSEEYDTVFFSMYPVKNYEEGDWLHFRAMDIVKTAYEIPNGKVLQKYMDTTNASGNTVTTVYLGIAPKDVAVEEIVNMLQQNQTVSFEVSLAYPEIDYWTELSDKKCSELLQAYQTMADGLLTLPNVNLHLFSGEEWLICNPANYADAGNTNVEVSQFLMCNMDIQHPYRLTAENVQERFAAMQAVIEKYRDGEVVYPNASDVEIVFFGDSIIGNYTNSLSVPEVVSGLSGATVYNCGYGGKGAALNELTQTPFPAIVDALINNDLSILPADARVYEGVKAFVEREQDSAQLMFVINYGLNDYFNGVAIATEDDSDITCYSGALRLGIEKLQKAYPEAQILLMTPNFTTYFENGQQKMSEQGGVLEDYAEAVLQLAEELNVDVLDNFHELPITAENWRTYQDDGCHLNERGRFLLGSRIAQRIKTD